MRYLLVAASIFSLCLPAVSLYAQDTKPAVQTEKRIKAKKAVKKQKIQGKQKQKKKLTPQQANKLRAAAEKTGEKREMEAGRQQYQQMLEAQRRGMQQYQQMQRQTGQQ